MRGEQWRKKEARRTATHGAFLFPSSLLPLRHLSPIVTSRSPPPPVLLPYGASLWPLFPRSASSRFLCDLRPQVLDWIENHGEAFLSKHTGVGKSLHRARALQKRHEDFEEVAQVPQRSSSRSSLGQRRVCAELSHRLVGELRPRQKSPPFATFCFRTSGVDASLAPPSGS